MLEKVVNKDKMRGLGRRDDDGYRRRYEQHVPLPEEPVSKLDEAVLSPEYDAMKQIQERVKALRGGHGRGSTWAGAVKDEEVLSETDVCDGGAAGGDRQQIPNTVLPV